MSHLSPEYRRPNEGETIAQPLLPVADLGRLAAENTLEAEIKNPPLDAGLLDMALAGEAGGYRPYSIDMLTFIGKKPILACPLGVEGEIIALPKGFDGRLLAKEDEIILSQYIQAGLNAAAMLEYDQAGDWPEQRLRILESVVKDGKNATDQIIFSNMRLLKKIVRNPSYKNHLTAGFGVNDLENEVLASGLLRAAKKFDWRKGYRFSTYATKWMHQGSNRSIDDKSKTIRIPTNLVNHVLAADRLIRDAYSGASQGGGTRTLTEISPQELRELAEKNDYKMIAERVDDIIIAARLRMLASLDQPVSAETTGGQASTLYDLTPADDTADQQHQLIEDKIIVQSILGLLAPKPGDDAKTKKTKALSLAVIKLRFGLEEGGQPMTTAQIGKLLGIHWEKVRLIEKRALDSIRHQLAVKTDKTDSNQPDDI